MRTTNVLFSLLVLVVCLTALFAQSSNKSNPSEVSGSTISGRVVAQGKPVPGAVLTLWWGFSEPTPSTTAGTARTEASGGYELTNVRPGNYFISVTAIGFVTGKENQTILNIRPVTVVGTNAIAPINFDLVPEGVIKGVVTDADGQPVSRVPITLFPESLPEGAMPPLYARNLRTDDQGRYRIAGMPAGTYRVAAGYQPVAAATMFGRLGYKRTFYPDAADEAHAKVIEISTGSEIADVNIDCGPAAKTFSVHARIVDGRNGEPGVNLDYSVRAFLDGKGIGGMGTRGHSNARGEITIENVPPGEYSIRVPGTSGSWPVGEIPQAPNIFGESKHFEVTDKDVIDIEIRVVRAATVSGFVAIEGPATMDILSRVPQMHIVAMVMPKPGGANPIMRANIKPDGSFVFTGLLPGKLQFNFDAPVQLPLRLVRIERDGARLEHDQDIEAGDQITGLRVVLGYANSSIHGVVKLDGGPLPADIPGRAIVLRYGKSVDGVTVDSHGEFLLQHLSAGEYTLLVFARRANKPEWTTEQQITIPDDKISEVTISLDSTAKAAPARTRNAVVPR